jgi:tetratricopeptide (TPR) repeat protein
MKNLIIFLLVFISISFFSCKEKKYESNSVLLNKAKEAAHKNGEWEDAKSLAFKARKQDMNDPNARIMFALALEQCGDRDRAIEEIKVAVNLDPENFMAQYTKGRMLFKTEIYEDCPDPLEAAKN